MGSGPVDGEVSRPGEILAFYKRVRWVRPRKFVELEIEPSAVLYQT